MTDPLLYSFRRCPYAIRARLAIASSGLELELREIVLRQKPEAFLQASPSGTVPCLVTAEGVIDESLDVMLWALRQHDPEGWLDMPDEGFDWITGNDGPFKSALDRTKYAARYPQCDPEEQRDLAAGFLSRLDRQINSWIFGRPTLADYAILPFVRQFAFIDKTWFDARPWPDLQGWLKCFLASERFERVMTKYHPWQEGDPPVVFP
ncbi:MAG: glutathione S-transferase [Hoeflea sp.]|uniref:glutathione S-transferase n=1 Tax=Hoeflea sp. TaxID=1940281 RepID=UPI003297E216